MQIRPTNNLQNTQSVNLNTQKTEAGNTTAANQAPVDQLDLSAEAQMLSGGSEIRADRVAEVRAEIANGVYETDAKLDAAVERLLDQIA